MSREKHDDDVRRGVMVWSLGEKGLFRCANSDEISIRQLIGVRDGAHLIWFTR